MLLEVVSFAGVVDVDSDGITKKKKKGCCKTKITQKKKVFIYYILILTV